MLPFALETQPTWQRWPDGWMCGEAAAVCCGCGQALARVRCFTYTSRRDVDMYPGYRPNGAGVYVRKRTPRTPTYSEILGTKIDMGYIGLEVYGNTTVICHGCGKRQIVRGR